MKSWRETPKTKKKREACQKTTTKMKSKSKPNEWKKLTANIILPISRPKHPPEIHTADHENIVNKQTVYFEQCEHAEITWLNRRTPESGSTKLLIR